MNEGNDIVWLEAREARRAFGYKGNGSLRHAVSSGRLQQKQNSNPKHPMSMWLYGVPRELWNAVNPSLSVHGSGPNPPAHASPALNSEDQIQRIAEAVAARMGFVIAEELRKAASDIAKLEQREPQQEEPKRDLQQIIEERAREMARRIGFDSIDQAVKNLQTASAATGDTRYVVVAILAFQRRIDQFNEENQTALTAQDVVNDLRLYLAVCAYKARGQRAMSTRGSARDTLRQLIAHTAQAPAPAA